jgi:acetyl-CoA/propionyl-CoA carboxylase, biotin carboxylase, biotin carboxyl carrier protein
MKHTFTRNGQNYELDLTPTGNTWRAVYHGQEYEFSRQDSGPGRLILTLNGRTVLLYIAMDHDTRWIAFDGRTYALKKQTRSRQAHTGDANPEGILHAPMPGQVRAVNVQVGDSVTKGQTLLLLEAMKMEIRIQAPMDGVVTKIPVVIGEQVEKDQVLIDIG